MFGPNGGSDGKSIHRYELAFCCALATQVPIIEWDRWIIKSWNYHSQSYCKIGKQIETKSRSNPI